MKYLLISLIIFLGVLLTYGQSKFEVYAGIGYSNILKYQGSAQTFGLLPYGAPNYRVTYNGGINFELYSNYYFNLKIGLGYYQRGSSDFISLGKSNLAPQLGYIRFPININYKLLNDKHFYFSGGIAPGILVKNYSKVIDFNAFTAAKKFQIDYELGIIFPVYKHFNCKITFAKGILPIDDPDSGISFRFPNYPPGLLRNINISYDLNLIYKF